ncbi:hypothetical protein [Leisingera sp. M523]|uniref:hypothetical protein n=1 Tax=Leisingera sp. M523 TaxID=2867013 RepID=UPI0021A43500|nr:hypothetical protein [Leisingera sp. M523]UWQ27700.1 hypothetical protein K3557_12925 [Leisingera sp. M523]
MGKYDGITLPVSSRAEQYVSLASAGHCSANAVLGSNEYAHTQAKKLTGTVSPAFAEYGVKCQLFSGASVLLLRLEPQKQSKHVFDFIATMTDGSKIAYTIKPEKGLVSGRFLQETEVGSAAGHPRRTVSRVGHDSPLNEVKPAAGQCLQRRIGSGCRLKAPVVLAVGWQVFLSNLRKHAAAFSFSDFCPAARTAETCVTIWRRHNL